MALLPTKKITALPPFVAPLTGSEELEAVQIGNSVKVSSRAFVLPTDSLLTMSGMGGFLPGSRQLVSSATIQVNDGGPAGQVTLDALFTGALPGNPTSLIGLTPINGAAVTWMRSDAAPALDQGITPIWTGNHTFAANQNQVRNALPQWIFVETDAAADNQAWPIRISGEQFNIGALNDLGSVFTPWVTVDRTGTVIDAVNLQALIVQVNGQNVRDAAILTSGTVSTARLGSGIADATTWLRGDQSWQGLPGGFTGFANPTALLGLVAVNGVATTAMRSDAAPALDQGIAPTWTSQHIFSLSGATNSAILVSSPQPQADWNETDAAANNRRWRWGVQGEQLLGQVVNDANSAAISWIVVDRTLNVVDSIALTSTALTWNGSPILTQGTAFANPTGTIGLAAVNGVATTAMRSDAAPPLSQAIAPTWTAQHVFSLAGTTATPTVRLSASRVDLEFNETDAAADNRRWFWRAESEQFAGYVSNDASSVNNSWITVDRTGTVLDLTTLRTARVDITNPAAGSVDLFINDANSPADNRLWRLRGNSAGQLQWGAVNDALSVANNFMLVDRTGATIDSVAFPTTTSGSFMVGTSTSLLGVTSQFVSAGNNVAHITSSSANWCLIAWNQATAGNNLFIEFDTENSITARGSINYNRGAGLVAYNTTSDVRRKKNITDAPEASEIIDGIQVRSFDWIDSDTHLDHWFVAQELAGIAPLAVTRGEGDRDWSIDPAKLVPVLVKELQSVRRRLFSLEQGPR